MYCRTCGLAAASMSVTLLCLQVDGVVPDAEAFPGRDFSSCLAADARRAPAGLATSLQNLPTFFRCCENLSLRHVSSQGECQAGSHQPDIWPDRLGEELYNTADMHGVYEMVRVRRGRASRCEGENEGLRQVRFFSRFAPFPLLFGLFPHFCHSFSRFSNVLCMQNTRQVLPCVQGVRCQMSSAMVALRMVAPAPLTNRRFWK